MSHDLYFTSVYVSVISFLSFFISVHGNKISDQFYIGNINRNIGYWKKVLTAELYY